jgi:hypothetical protein
VEISYQMDAVASTDIIKTCVKYVYSAIWGSGQFESACIKWKGQPAADRATMGQIRTFFAKKYDVYDAPSNLLHSAGVANSVQLQDLRGVTNDGLTSVRDRRKEQDNFVEEQVNFNNATLQMVKSNTMDDNATAFSAMALNTAAKDRRIEELESDPNDYDPPLKVVAALVVVAVTVDEDPLVVVVAVTDPVVVEDPVVAEDPEAEAITADTEAMDRPIAPRIANSMPTPTPTAGPVVMMFPKSMRATPATTNYRATKTQ